MIRYSISHCHLVDYFGDSGRDFHILKVVLPGTSRQLVWRLGCQMPAHPHKYRWSALSLSERGSTSQCVLCSSRQVSNAANNFRSVNYVAS
jgi:hypothetical protein